MSGLITSIKIHLHIFVFIKIFWNNLTLQNALSDRKQQLKISLDINHDRNIQSQNTLSWKGFRKHQVLLLTLCRTIQNPNSVPESNVQLFLLCSGLGKLSDHTGSSHILLSVPPSSPWTFIGRSLIVFCLLFWHPKLHAMHKVNMHKYGVEWESLPLTSSLDNQHCSLTVLW